jgi:fluoroquinolone transport system permease protein
MLVTLAKFEIKNLIRDRMTLVMLLWPLILGAIGKYLISSGVLEGQAVSSVSDYGLCLWRDVRIFAAG